MTLVIRNALSPEGRQVDLRLDAGRIVEIGQALASAGDTLDAAGATVLPGLHDHHIHIFAEAARRQSVDLSGLTSGDMIKTRLAQAAIGTAPGQWVRAIGYDERAAGIPDRDVLDRWLVDRPVRLQDRTGALWVFNSQAMDTLKGLDLPKGAERDSNGEPNGRFWREDDWIGHAIPRSLPDLSAFGETLSSMGLTGLSDASWKNGVEEAELLGQAHMLGHLPQKLMLMGTEALGEQPGMHVGAVKLLIDHRSPPNLDDLADRIIRARALGRNVAAHCVTSDELALFLAALDLADGVRSGDRIEHGGVIPESAIAEIAARGLTVVTNPAFIHSRGERYRVTVPETGWSELYRARSLIDAGIAMAAGSDAPYGPVDPWQGMRTARDRLTMDGNPVSPVESVSAVTALSFYQSAALLPGRRFRSIAAGQPADLILCHGTMSDILADLTSERVQATLISGKVVWQRS